MAIEKNTDKWSIDWRNHSLKCWPNKKQIQLIKASLLSGKQAEIAYQKWMHLEDFNAIDPGSYRLLPLLYRNLKKNSIRPQNPQKLKGIYRHTWSKNKLLLHNACSVFEKLNEADISVMLLKGASLAAKFYPDSATRYMHDVDCMVQKDRIKEALCCFEQENYHTIKVFHENDFNIRHAASLCKGKVAKIDLHWEIGWDKNRPEFTKALWEEAKPFYLQGVRVEMLPPTELLFHSLTHGISINEYTNFQWIADAYFIIHSNQGVDWNKFIRITKELNLEVPIQHALNFLNKILEIQIPEGVLYEINSIDSNLFNKMEFRYYTDIAHDSWVGKVLGGLPMMFFMHRRRNYNDGILKLLYKFPAYLNLLAVQVMGPNAGLFSYFSSRIKKRFIITVQWVKNSK